jgi:hypothetical protein
MSQRESYLIKQSRQIILESLNITYPSPMMVRSLMFAIISSVNMAYNENLVLKDLTYLQDKGYLTIVEKVGLSPILPFEKRLVRLTAKGKEIAERTMSDPALEI